MTKAVAANSALVNGHACKPKISAGMSCQFQQWNGTCVLSLDSDVREMLLKNVKKEVCISLLYLDLGVTVGMLPIEVSN